MKRSFDLRLIIILVAAVIYTITSTAQKVEKLDSTPHDIAYYRTSKIDTPLVKVLYGRPTHKKNVQIFGAEVPFNEIWRTGANEATEIKIYKDVMFGNKLVSAGTYVIYTIPNKDQWEVILNSNTDVLGAYQYDSIFDVVRIKVPVTKAENMATFSIGFNKVAEKNITMVFAWASPE